MKDTESLHLDEALARSLLETSPIITAVANLAGEILFLNQRGRQIARISSGQDLPNVGSIYADPAQQPIVRAKLMAQGKLDDEEVQFKALDGSLIWGLMTMRIITYAGQPAIAAWIYDITRQKETEAALAEARDAAQMANKTKEEFLANMSHELRTPLNAIIGYSQILGEEVEDIGHTELMPDLKRIESAGKHLLGLINDVLDLSKIEAGRMELYYEVVATQQIADEVRSIGAPLASARGNELIIDIEPGFTSLHTDFTKVKQCLLNLVSNACKFTENGQVRVRISKQSDWAIFSVSDTGIGMTEAQIGRLFQAFSQADASTTRQYGGTGLGLAITQRMCHLMNGEVSVSSKPGAGSTFTIQIPANPAAPAEAPFEIAADIKPGARGVGPSVLLVDDDPQIHRLLGVMLERDGFTVEHCSSGKDAVEHARRLRPAVILLDVMMPQVDGWTVLGTLKQDAELKDIPVVIVSLLDERPLGLSLGAAEFLTKPVDRPRLIRTVRAHMGEVSDTVMVVDDDENDREAFARLLSGQGFRVVKVSGGQQALDALERGTQPAVMLLDLMMQGIDGFSVLDRIRAHAQWKDIKVIVLSAKDITTQEADFLIERGCTVIPKGPMGQEALAQALQGLRA